MRLKYLSKVFFWILMVLIPVSVHADITKIAPSDGSEFYKGTDVIFDWQDVSGASYYEIWIDNNDGFGSPEIGYDNGQSPNWVNDGVVSTSQFTLTVPLQTQLPQNVYFWIVKAFNSSDQLITESTSYRSFSLLDELSGPGLR